MWAYKKSTALQCHVATRSVIGCHKNNVTRCSFKKSVFQINSGIPMTINYNRLAPSRPAPTWLTQFVIGDSGTSCDTFVVVGHLPLKFWYFVRFVHCSLSNPASFLMISTAFCMQVRLHKCEMTKLSKIRDDKNWDDKNSHYLWCLFNNYYL